MVGYIKNFITGTLPVTMLLFVCVLVWRFVRMGKIKQKYRVTVLREIALMIFLFYLCATASATCVGYGFFDNSYNGRGFLDNINIIPLKSLKEFFHINEMGLQSRSVVIANIFGNIGLFVPIGFAVSLLRDFSPKKSIFICFLITCGIEILQLPLLRVTDIDDVILNTAGAAAGCAINLILRRICPGFCEKFKLRELSGSRLSE